MPLKYEIRVRKDDATSVDFLLDKTAIGKPLNIEMRLIQQRDALTKRIDEQVSRSGQYEIHLDGAADRAETLRLQRLIFEKAVNVRGEVVKFQPRSNGYNIVAIEVSELHLGTIDPGDCLLATYGDPAVSKWERRQLFGLFQTPREEYPKHIQEAAARYAPFRETVHAVLFLRKVPPSSSIDFRVEYLFVHNKNLMSADEAIGICRDLIRGMEVWESVRKTKESSQNSRG